MYISTVKRIIIKKNIENLIFMNKKTPVLSIISFFLEKIMTSSSDNDNGNFFLIGASPLAEG